MGKRLSLYFSQMFFSFLGFLSASVEVAHQQDVSCEIWFHLSEDFVYQLAVSAKFSQNGFEAAHRTFYHHDVDHCLDSGHLVCDIIGLVPPLQALQNCRLPLGIHSEGVRCGTCLMFQLTTVLSASIDAVTHLIATEWLIRSHLGFLDGFILVTSFKFLVLLLPCF